MDTGRVSLFSLLMCYTYPVLHMDKMSVFSSMKERWNALLREQKIAVGILASCGLVALVFSFQRLGAGLNDPFMVSRASFESAKQVVNTIDPTQTQEAEARRRDTDGDGISDWDEQHVFGTSPYLADTDGDGIPDNVEIAMGENPNCPANKVCTSQPIDTNSLASSSFPFVSGLANSAGNQGDTFLADFQKGINQGKATIASQTGSTSTDLQPALLRDPVEIRKVIAASGKVDAQTLSQITDTQLLDLYDQALAQSAQQGLQDVASSTGSTSLPTPDPSTTF